MISETSQEVVEALALASSVDEIHAICMRIISRIDADHADRIPISLPADEPRKSRRDSERGLLVTDFFCDEASLLSSFPQKSQEQGCNQNQVARPFVFLFSPQLAEGIRRSPGSARFDLNKSELTEREKECLYWAAEGKTAWETAKILKISKRTVVFHLQNASRKLNAANCQNAIARAVVLGLITPQVS